jgi:hypothetical protein
MATYIYKPLEEPHGIRVLELHSSRSVDELYGIIHHQALDGVVPFNTLSYAWENAEKCEVLKTPEGSMLITSSLANALRRLRGDDDPLLIWADAICINQSDNEERSSQVSLMAQIYSKASCTLVWLGHEADDSDLVFPLFERIVAAGEIPSWNVTTKNQTPEILRERNLPAKGDGAWTALWAFLNRSWFKRVWIVQEFVVSADVQIYCGDKYMHWEVAFQAIHLVHASSLLGALFPSVGKDELRARFSLAMVPSKLKRLRAGFRDGHRDLLLDLLNLSRSSQASETRDHLFAMLGLASDSDSPWLYPDYIESYSSVLRRYAAFFVEEGQGIEMLYLAGLAEGCRHPSWIPNWTSESPQGTIDLHRFKRYRSYAASSELYAEMSFDPEHDVLKIRGSLGGVLSFIGEDDDDDVGVSEVGQRTLRVISYYFQYRNKITSLPSYPTGEDLQDVTWKALIGNAITYGERTYSEIEMEISAMSWLDFITRLTESSDFDDDLFVAAKPYFLELGSMRRYFRVCISENGYVGLAPNIAQLEDIVFVPLGSEVPFIIQKSDERSGCFRFVGQCYIHGMMNGETLEHDLFPPEYIYLH